MANLHKVTIYLSSYKDGENALSHLKGDLYHGPYLYEIEEEETIEVGGSFHGGHVLNQSSTWEEISKFYESHKDE